MSKKLIWAAADSLAEMLLNNKQVLQVKTKILIPLADSFTWLDHSTHAKVHFFPAMI